MLGAINTRLQHQVDNCQQPQPVQEQEPLHSVSSSTPSIAVDVAAAVAAAAAAAAALDKLKHAAATQLADQDKTIAGLQTGIEQALTIQSKMVSENERLAQQLRATDPKRAATANYTAAVMSSPNTHTEAANTIGTSTAPAGPAVHVQTLGGLRTPHGTAAHVQSDLIEGEVLEPSESLRKERDKLKAEVEQLGTRLKSAHTASAALTAASNAAAMSNDGAVTAAKEEARKAAAREKVQSESLLAATARVEELETEALEAIAAAKTNSLSQQHALESKVQAERIAQEEQAQRFRSRELELEQQVKELLQELQELQEKQHQQQDDARGRESVLAATNAKLLAAEANVQVMQAQHLEVIAEHDTELAAANTRVFALETRMQDVAKAATAATAAAAKLASNTNANAAAIEVLVSERDATAAGLEDVSKARAALEVKYLALKAERDMLQRKVDNDLRIADRGLFYKSGSPDPDASAAALDTSHASTPIAMHDGGGDAAAVAWTPAEPGNTRAGAHGDDSTASSLESLIFNTSRQFEEEEAATIYAGLPSPLLSVQIKADLESPSPPPDAPPAALGAAASLAAHPPPHTSAAAPPAAVIANETQIAAADDADTASIVATNTADSVSQSVGSFVSSPTPRFDAARLRGGGALLPTVDSPSAGTDAGGGTFDSSSLLPLEDTVPSRHSLSLPHSGIMPRAGYRGGEAAAPAVPDKDEEVGELEGSAGGDSKEYAVSVALDSPPGSVGEAISSEYLEEEIQIGTEIGTMLAQQAAALHSALAAQLKGMVHN